jgi:hypothetical protein
MPRILRLTALLLVVTSIPSAPQTSSSKTKHPEQHDSRDKTPPTSAETLYRNPEFAFAYKIPYAWVDRTQQMQDDSSDPAKSRLLLAVFERPPEAIGDTVNSAVVITAESSASYPGLKTAADYLGPLTELTTSKGFKSAADPSEIEIGSTPLVRADFAKDLGRLTMRQTSLVLLRKKFVLSFTFIADSEDQIDELIERLSLNSAKPQ